MSRRYLIPGVAALLILLTLNVMLAPDPLANSATSFGVKADGYKAAYELLAEMGIPLRRSYVIPSLVDSAQTLWFVGPSFLDPEDSTADKDIAELRKWAANGGTAVILGDPDSHWESLDIQNGTAAGANTTVVSGTLVQSPRTIPIPRLMHFKQGKDRLPARLKADDMPFALELKVGNGRIIAIADRRFLSNEYLAVGDCSVLLADLVRSLGAPTFDERCHGLAPPASFVRAMAASRAMVPLILGLLAAIAWAAQQHSWPRRILPDPPEAQDPSVVSYVDSLGVLYSRGHDPAAVFRAYRAGLLHRLRRQASPRREITESAFIARIARDRSIDAETRRWLIDGASPASEDQLITAVRAIESYRGARV
jgi:hypothetical protein